jgi:hypothetical protein
MAVVRSAAECVMRRIASCWIRSCWRIRIRRWFSPSTTILKTTVARFNSTQEAIKVSISGVKELELLTEGGEGHNHNSWAIWAEPQVHR